MWHALSDPFLHFVIIRGAIQKGRLFSCIFCQFSSFCWSNFDLELIYFALSMNTLSYSPIASGTYNRWKVEFVLKTKMTKTSIQCRLWWNLIQHGLAVPIFIHSRSLLFEGDDIHRIPGKPGTTKPVLVKFRNNSDKTGVMKTRCNRPEFRPSQFFPWGKTGPAHFFPGEETDMSVFFPTQSVFFHLIFFYNM